MERTIIKSDDGMTKKEVWTCQSATERDAQLAIFPWPIPSTHELYYRWLDEMHYEVGMRPKQQAAAVPVAPAVGSLAPTGAVPAVTTIASIENGTATVSTTPAHPFDADAATLARMKREDMRTLATQESIPLEDFLAKTRNASNVQAAAFVKDAWEKKKVGK